MKIKIKADLHTHTIASGHAYSTVDELAKSASEKGLKLIAITNHGPKMPGGPHQFHFGNMRIIPDELYGVRIISGIEANIMNDGSIDLPEERLKRLDFVAAGIHSDAGYDLNNKKDNTRVLIKAMENPYVQMITHPANAAFPINIEEVVEAADEYNIILEANASSFYDFKLGRRGNHEMSIKLCELAKNKGVLLSLNSDAHFHTEVGDITFLNDVIQKAKLTEEDIINSSAEKVKNFLEL